MHLNSSIIDCEQSLFFAKFREANARDLRAARAASCVGARESEKIDCSQSSSIIKKCPFEKHKYYFLKWPCHGFLVDYVYLCKFRALYLKITMKNSFIVKIRAT